MEVPSICEKLELNPQILQRLNARWWNKQCHSISNHSHHSLWEERAQLPPHKEMNQRDTDHLKLQSTHAHNTLFISQNKAICIFTATSLFMTTFKKGLKFSFLLSAWLIVYLHEDAVNLFDFPLYTYLNPGKTAWRNHPSPFLAARPLMSVCPMWHFCAVSKRQERN